MDSKGMSGYRIIEDVVVTLGRKNLPVVREKDAFPVLVDAMFRFPHSRLVYVVDDDNRLLGTVSLDTLVRHGFYHRHDTRVHPRSIINLITSDTAADIMDRKPFHLSPGDEVERALDRMIHKNIREAPVVDEGGRIVGDITILDMLKIFGETL